MKIRPRLRKKSRNPAWCEQKIARHVIMQIKVDLICVSLGQSRALAALAPKIKALPGTEFMSKASSHTAERASASANPVSYEAAVQELEQLVTQMESGQLPLEQLLVGYQRGAQLLSFCRDKLAAVEDQIKVLDETGLKTWTQD